MNHTHNIINAVRTKLITMDSMITKHTFKRATSGGCDISRRKSYLTNLGRSIFFYIIWQ